MEWNELNWTGLDRLGIEGTSMAFPQSPLLRGPRPWLHTAVTWQALKIQAQAPLQAM